MIKKITCYLIFYGWVIVLLAGCSSTDTNKVDKHTIQKDNVDELSFNYNNYNDTIDLREVNGGNGKGVTVK
ncbi:hypothetical protein GCM10008967_27740 [Bacillus carboniphilus]|uniref:Lipoprotein n=1 Tax=Bacillus carboniphilus TaxID=86663 RepID=A0ABN0WF77_9BACI